LQNLREIIKNMVTILRRIHMTQLSHKVRPLYDRVLVRRIETEQTTIGGIIIPDTAQEKTQLGTIVAIGEGKTNTQGTSNPLKVKSGDTVLFGKYAGTEIKFGNEEYLILKEDELLGVIEEK
jgi:chaperonin GroES